MRRFLAKTWRWVGLLSGIVGLIVLVNLVDARAVAAALTGANPLLLLAAAMLVLLTTALRTRRWTHLFQQRKVNIPFLRLLGTNLIGSFYGQFLPLSSAVGASLLFTESARVGGKTVDFIATVLVERLLNLAALSAAASLVLLVAQPVGLPAALRLTTYLAATGVLAALLLLRQDWGGGGVGRVLARLRLGKVGRAIEALSQALQSELGERRVLARGLALSVLINASVMATSYLTTLAVAGPVPLLSFLVMAALIVTLQGIPITPGSLGMREGLYVFFLGLLGVSKPQALTVGLLMMLLHWIQGVIGGLVLLQRSLPEVTSVPSGADIPVFSRPRRALVRVQSLASANKRPGEVN
jgi:uncharacterized protein (TIRG00374 family)